MTLGVTIGKEERDNFAFPSLHKRGCDLDLDLNFMQGNGQGPVTGGGGCVKSNLST